MQTPSVPTTILFRPGVFKRLKLLSQEQNKPISEIVNTAVRGALEIGDQPRLERMYKGLFTLVGTGKKGVSDASSTIDDVLFGEAGAWKGENE